MKENGNISIHTENIFPIIKKWLYSDKDIFIRELISNGCDAVHKFQRLVSLGEAEKTDDEKYEIKVSVNKENKTLKFQDNGIGMTAEEVKKYITQVAFSGAEDFIKKYKESTEEGNSIIGHFGLGFYSAFMVADMVQIDTLSFVNGAEPVRWVCEGGTDYVLSDSTTQKTRGTTITLYLNEESSEFLEDYTVRSVIEKYCSFMPVEIYLENENVKEEHKDEKGEIIPPKPLNDINPLWTKMPKDCTDEEYKEFYKKEFRDFNDPLFWIHLNVDYPFNLKGILYFPKLKHEFEATEGQVKLYNNQVYVADNIKEVVPEFLLLLKGVIDCPDLPLNVSRSFLQKDKNVMKISKHIVKKVADKLISVFNNERDNYNTFWKDIQIFIKYGCLRDESFYDKIKDVIIFKTINNKYVTLKDYLEENKEKHENKVFYVNNESEQAQYVKMFKDNNLDALVLNCSIDNHFISFLESKNPEVKFARIDADIADTLKGTDELSAEDKEKIVNLFKENIDNKELKVSAEPLLDNDASAVITISEESRRMIEMSKMYGNLGMADMFKEEKTLVVNSNNEIVKKLASMEQNEDTKNICNYIYDLAKIANGGLSSEEMNQFIKRSSAILKMTL